MARNDEKGQMKKTFTNNDPVVGGLYTGPNRYGGHGTYLLVIEVDEHVIDSQEYWHIKLLGAKKVYGFSRRKESWARDVVRLA